MPQKLTGLYRLVEILLECSTPIQVRTKNRIEKAISYLNENYKEEIDVPALASMCGMSQAAFFRSFRENVRDTPIEYLKKLRLSMALYYLETTELSIGEIADVCGFLDGFYFSKVFKNMIGVPPTTYRKMDRERTI